MMKTKEMVRTGLMCAVICAVSPLSIPLPISPVPVTLATFVLYLTAFLLKKKQALAACLIYLAVGFVGMPVFAGFSGGVSRLASPTGGYLIGYLALVWISAFLLERLQALFFWRVMALTVGTAVCYLFGTAWLCAQMDVSPAAGFTMAVLPYLPLDLAKIAAAAAVGPKIAAALKRAGM